MTSRPASDFREVDGAPRRRHRAGAGSGARGVRWGGQRDAALEPGVGPERGKRRERGVRAFVWF